MIHRDGNRIIFVDSLYISELPGALALLHQVVKAGYVDAILDFGSCTAALPAPVLAICSQVMKLRLSQFEFELVLPERPDLARHFINANWAHLLDPLEIPHPGFEVSQYSQRLSLGTAQPRRRPSIG